MNLRILILISVLPLTGCEATIEKMATSFGEAINDVMTMRAAPSIPPVLAIGYKIENKKWPYGWNEYSILHKKLEPSKLALPICKMVFEQLGENYFSIDYAFFIESNVGSKCARPFSVKVTQLDTEEECYEITDYTVIGEVYDLNGRQYDYDRIDSNLKEPICASNKSLNMDGAKSAPPN
jgi:hypothetical protein